MMARAFLVGLLANIYEKHFKGTAYIVTVSSFITVALYI